MQLCNVLNIIGLPYHLQHEGTPRCKACGLNNLTFYRNHRDQPGCDMVGSSWICIINLSFFFKAPNKNETEALVRALILRCLRPLSSQDMAEAEKHRKDLCDKRVQTELLCLYIPSFR